MTTEFLLSASGNLKKIGRVSQLLVIGYVGGDVELRLTY